MLAKIKILSVLFFLFTVHVSYGQKSEEELVRSSFDKYKSAILNDKGDEAVNYVDSRTIKYYTQILELVKTADSSEINKLSVLDKLMVLSIRHRISKRNILSFDGRALLVYAIKTGMVGKNSVLTNSIGEVVIDGTFAKGQFLTNGVKTPFYFHFYKEEGEWKMDLTSLFQISATAFKKIVDESGKTENDYLIYLLEMMTSKKPGPEIWLPIN